MEKSTKRKVLIFTSLLAIGGVAAYLIYKHNKDKAPASPLLDDGKPAPDGSGTGNQNQGGSGSQSKPNNQSGGGTSLTEASVSTPNLSLIKSNLDAAVGKNSANQVTVQPDGSVQYKYNDGKNLARFYENQKLVLFQARNKKWVASINAAFAKDGKTLSGLTKQYRDDLLTNLSNIRKDNAAKLKPI